MSKKRIHDLAKEYGMSGKDLASKLRDFGFSQAKSHMSALDEFELMQAEALLDVNGIVRSAGEQAAETVAESGGGLKIRKKSKTTSEIEMVEVEAMPHPDHADDSPPPEVPPIVEAEAEPEETPPDPVVEEAPVEPEAAAAEAEADVVPDEPETVAEDVVPVESTAEVVEAPEAPLPEAVAEADATIEAEVEEPAPSAELPEKAAAEATPAATTPEAGDAKSKTGPKGKVVGFVDPTSFQRAAGPKRRSESRRLQSRDEDMPEVRPTFAHDRSKALQRGAGGARGTLTAAQLREREQGRFLRRSRPGGPGGAGGGGRGRGGPRTMHRDDVTDSPLRGQTIAIEAPVTIGKLAEGLKLKANIVLKTALQKKFGMFNVNSVLDDDTAGLLGEEFGVELDIRHEISAEQAHLEEVMKKRSEVEEADLGERAPTVAFLGHVDHGKTTLIDHIRATKIADHESGGITQHIGAYQVTTKAGHTLTIVDTPGHAAFTAMRARGAKSVDIVVLVVAGDDGVKPHTEEAVNHARAAETPIVVAVNKKDKPGYNFDSTVQQLMGHGLTPEQYGGQTAFFQTSGMTGEGIDEMLDHVFLMAEAELGLNAHAKGPASGVVLEAEIQQGKGIVAHLLVQDGTLKRGDVILAGEGYGKVKSIHNDRGKTIQEAGPAMPVEVAGLAALPGVGDPFHVVEQLGRAKEIAVERERNNRAVAMAQKREPSKELESILGSAPKTERKAINLLVRCDVQGSVEVIRNEIEKLDHDEINVKLIHSGVGPITESDVDLAATSDAMLVAFHVGVNGKARTAADRYGLDVRRYEVIYELFEDIHDLMEGALSPEFAEEITGHVEIRRIFKSSKVGMIAGCYVLDGKIARSNKVRLMRDDQVVYTGGIATLRREKDEAKEVREGFECGIVLKDYKDIKEGDIIETFRMKEVKRTLEGGRS